jgi:hypothetical protein
MTPSLAVPDEQKSAATMNGTSAPSAHPGTSATIPAEVGIVGAAYVGVPLVAAFSGRASCPTHRGRRPLRSG